MREIFTRHEGQEVDTQGDSFFVSFPRATEAVSAAVEAHLSPEQLQGGLTKGSETEFDQLIRSIQSEQR